MQTMRWKTRMKTSCSNNMSLLSASYERICMSNLPASIWTNKMVHFVIVVVVLLRELFIHCTESGSIRSSTLHIMHYFIHRWPHMIRYEQITFYRPFCQSLHISLTMWQCHVRWDGVGGLFSAMLYPNPFNRIEQWRLAIKRCGIFLA